MQVLRRAQTRTSRPRRRTIFGTFLIVRGRGEEAEAAFREAVAHEHPDASSELAAVEVARLLADRPGRK